MEARNVVVSRQTVRGCAYRVTSGQEARVAAGFEQNDGVTRLSKSSRDRSTARSGAHDDVLAIGFR